MNLISVNVGKEQPVPVGPPRTTGIYKLPSSQPVRIGELGLDGDTIVDLENHGGADQAVYVYGSADYDWWSAELGQMLKPGTFGENLTISDLASATLYVGDRLHIGQVVLEISSPRIPCSKLAARMADPKFVKRFRIAARPGVYCRVIEAGSVLVGDPVTIEAYGANDPTKAAQRLSVIEMFDLYYDDPLSERDLRRMLAVPIASRTRKHYQAQLTQLLNTEA